MIQEEEGEEEENEDQESTVLINLLQLGCSNYM
jgi:hypothetical protein